MFNIKLLTEFTFIIEVFSHHFHLQEKRMLRKDSHPGSRGHRAGRKHADFASRFGARMNGMAYVIARARGESEAPARNSWVSQRRVTRSTCARRDSKPALGAAAARRWPRASCASERPSLRPSDRLSSLSLSSRRCTSQ
jgi:hypothetical protein